MENIGWIILVTFIAGVLGTGIGGVIGALFKKNSGKCVSLLLSFAGGIMLGVVAFDLIPESLKPYYQNKNDFYYILIAVFGTIIGFLLVYLINHFIDKKLSREVPHTRKHIELHDDLDEMIHLDHVEVHKKSDNHLFIAGLVTATVIALHNLPEGIVIGATYSAQPGLIVGGSGLVISIVIGLHNIPEGMAVSVPLISGGTKKWKAILITAASGIPTIIGAIIGFAVGNIGPIGLSISLSIASGAMLYVVFGELLPEAFLMWKSKLPALTTLAGVLLGLVLVLI